MDQEDPRPLEALGVEGLFDDLVDVGQRTPEGGPLWPSLVTPEGGVLLFPSGVGQDVAAPGAEGVFGVFFLEVEVEDFC